MKYSLPQGPCQIQHVPVIPIIQFYPIIQSSLRAYVCIQMVPSSTETVQSILVSQC